MQIDKYYYIGFNANNAIMNESFFSGSITLNPNGEKGNIYYSLDFVADTSSESFKNEYLLFIKKNIEKLKKNNTNNHFLCFNKKVQLLCSEIDDADIIIDNNDVINDILNNKFTARDLVKDLVPVLNYEFSNNGKDYGNLTKKLKSDKLVYQLSHGAGGFETFLIDSNKMAQNLCEGNYCVSKYINNVPINVTTVISDDDILLFPVSAQLIKITNGCFKYVGADFKYASTFEKSIISEIYRISKNICERIQGKGYRGILGIDYMYTPEKIVFMEFNPRFQSSSFLLNMELEKKGLSCLAKLHYESISHKKLSAKQVDIDRVTINKSFLNCSKDQDILNIKENSQVLNGYYEKNCKSVYRKIYNKSIIELGEFEKL